MCKKFTEKSDLVEFGDQPPVDDENNRNRQGQKGKQGKESDDGGEIIPVKERDHHFWVERSEWSTPAAASSLLGNFGFGKHRNAAFWFVITFYSFQGFVFNFHLIKTITGYRMKTSIKKKGKVVKITLYYQPITIKILLSKDS